MQKWIRDRMRRRKKKPTEQDAAREANPPLQPAYPDDIAEPVEEPEPQSIVEDQGEAKQETPARPKRRRKKRSVRSAAAAKQPAPETGESEEGGSAEIADSREAVAESATAVGDRVEEVPEPAEGPAGNAREAVVRQDATNAPVQTPPAPKVHKESKGAVVLAVGLPGSGKSTWFKRHGVTPLSSDMVRHLLFDNPTEQRYQDLVFGTLRSLLRARLIARMPMNYVDATNLSPKERRHWIRMAKDFGYDAHAVYFDVPMELCMERNRRRNRVVPEDVMNRMSAKLRPPTFDEGFAKIVVVRVKSKAEVPGESDVADAGDSAPNLTDHGREE